MAKTRTPQKTTFELAAINRPVVKYHRPLVGQNNLLNAGLRALSKLPPVIVSELVHEVKSGKEYVRLYSDRDKNVAIVRRSDFRQMQQLIEDYYAYLKEHASEPVTVRPSEDADNCTQSDTGCQEKKRLGPKPPTERVHFEEIRDSLYTYELLSPEEQRLLAELRKNSHNVTSDKDLEAAEQVA